MKKIKNLNFPSRFADFVTKHHILILILSLILIIPSFFGMINTDVNYDMLNYLPEDIDTSIGQRELLNEFHKGAFSILVVEDLPDNDLVKLTENLKKIDHVDTVLGKSALLEQGIPPEILPDRFYEAFNKDNETLVAIFFDTSTSADETVKAITEIREIVKGRAYVSGMSALITDLREVFESEEIIYIIIGASLVLITMIILMDNWLIPIIFLISIGVMILFNMGTNFMLKDISYITKSLAAVLQLAVTMDYSIFLWHSYRKNKSMKIAISETFSSVIGSSTTTIAGFIALMFMSFSLGFDLGLVMAKGVLLGVIGSVTILPSLIMLFDKPLSRTDHRPLLPSFKKVSNGITKIWPILLAVLVLIVPPALIGYKNTEENVYYELTKSLPEDMPFAIANSKLSKDFSISNMHMILNDATINESEIRKMNKEIEDVDGIKAVFNLEALLGPDVPLEILPNSITNILKSDKWELTLAISDYSTASDEANAQIDQLNSIVKKYDKKALLIGEASYTKDMIQLADNDFKIVNIVSIFMIFIIIAIVFKSISLPFILVLVIEIAIFINLGLPFYTGDRLPFIAPICISTIQLGATVDYAILMTTHYKNNRLSGKNKKSAVKNALEITIPSIIVSGISLFSATFGVFLLSNIDMIRTICMLMARGAIISIFAVPLFLSPLLILCDPLICKTTKGMNHLLEKGVKNA